MAPISIEVIPITPKKWSGRLLYFARKNKKRCINQHKRSHWFIHWSFKGRQTKFLYLCMMKHTNINTTIIDGYLDLLRNLSADSKLDLISRLTLSVKTDIADKKSYFMKSFGAFQSKKDVDQIIHEIRNSRNFNRTIEDIWKSTS